MKKYRKVLHQIKFMQREVSYAEISIWIQALPSSKADLTKYLHQFKVQRER